MKKNYLTFLLGGCAIIMVVVWLVDVVTSRFGSASWSQEGDSIVDAGGTSEFWFPWTQVWTPVTTVIVIALVLLFFVELFYKNDSNSNDSSNSNNSRKQN